MAGLNNGGVDVLAELRQFVVDVEYRHVVRLRAGRSRQVLGTATCRVHVAVHVRMVVLRQGGNGPLLLAETNVAVIQGQNQLYR